MAYYYATDWIFNTVVLNKIPLLIDSATQHDCELRCTPIHDPEGYGGQRFLIHAPTDEEMKHFVDEATIMIGLGKWFPIAETYFHQKSHHDLQRLRYKGTLVSNLSKVLEVWYISSIYNEKLRELLSESTPYYRAYVHIISEHTHTLLNELPHILTSPGIGRDIRLLNTDRNEANLYTLYLIARVFSEEESSEILKQIGDKLAKIEIGNAEDFLKSLELGLWELDTQFQMKLDEMINFNTSIFKEDR